MTRPIEDTTGARAPGTAAAQRLVAEHGTRWSKDPAPGLADVWEWSSVTAVAADDVWAYGTVRRDQRLVHFDGTRWTTVPTVGPVDDSFPEVPLDAVPG
ncbi:hypothetical protein ACPC3E_31550, partial [Streptomyces pseudogriseolus]